MAPPAVLVSGGGIAGLAARLAFKQLGVPVELIDMAPAVPRRDLDEPLVLTSNATRVLSRLGLGALVAKGHVVGTWAIDNAAGQPLGGADLAELALGRANYAALPPAVTMQSSELIRALLKAGQDTTPVIKGKVRVSAAAATGVRMATGVQELEEMDVGGTREVAVGFSSKSMRPKTYSLVVGADGVGSRVRELCAGPVGGTVKVTFPGWGLFWCTVPYAVCQPLLDGAGMREVWAGGQRFGVGALPQDRAFVWGTVNHERPLPPVKDPVLLGKQLCDSFAHMASADLPTATQNADSHAARIFHVLRHIRSAAAKSNVSFRYPATVKIDERGLQARGMAVALVGDAAHATHPALFQSCALALEDGYSLAHAVVRPGGGELLPDQELRQALEHWRKQRRRRASLTQEASEYVAKAAINHDRTLAGTDRGFLQSLAARIAGRALSVDKKALHVWLSKLYAD